jgi:hypothetical protein
MSHQSNTSTTQQGGTGMGIELLAGTPLACATVASIGTFCGVPTAPVSEKKLCIDPEVFDCIVEKIQSNPIFSNRSNNLQLPVSIQLAIFLNWAGHYGNAISTEDVA